MQKYSKNQIKSNRFPYWKCNEHWERLLIKSFRNSWTFSNFIYILCSTFEEQFIQFVNKFQRRNSNDRKFQLNCIHHSSKNLITKIDWKLVENQNFGNFDSLICCYGWNFLQILKHLQNAYYTLSTWIQSANPKKWYFIDRI